ncbi:MAG: MarR family transcriptional regulator [Candidatus Omnitrophota bacterium]|jgi:DNA-binding MarR family transcriptional regulator
MLKRFGINSGSENYRETAVYGLAYAYSLIENKIADYLRPFGLSVAKFNALLVVKHIGKEEGLSQGELGRRLIVTPSNITRLLDRLSQDGFIERLARKGDRRVHLIRITREGSDILDKAWPGYYKKVHTIANLMDEKKLRQVSQGIVDWCGKLDNTV